MSRSGGSSDAKPGPATRIVFDLDPGEDVTFRQLCEVAHEVQGYVDGHRPDHVSR